ncbi:hypothetical protein V2J09_007279 [Rumex salicifolius]
MASPGSSMVVSFLLINVVLSLQVIYRGKLASSELFTILGGFTSSILFLLSLTFMGNLQETCGMKSGWGTVILAQLVALVAAGTVHRIHMLEIIAKSFLELLSVLFCAAVRAQQAFSHYTFKNRIQNKEALSGCITS